MNGHFVAKKIADELSMKVKLKSFIQDHLKISTPFLEKENIIMLSHKDIKYLTCDFCSLPTSPCNSPIILLYLTSMKNLGGRMGKCLTQIRIFFFLPEICDYIIGTFIFQDIFTI
jgi:hypothetical protein